MASNESRRGRSLDQEVARRVVAEDSLAREIKRGIASEELLRLLLGSVRDYAIFMLDATGHVASWNIGAETIKGWTAEEIIGRHFSTFYPEEDVRAGKCEMELDVASKVGRFEDEGWRVRKDGSRFWANVVISAMRNDEGTLVGFSKVTRDLTERKRAEEERAARLAAEQANRAKDEFLAMLGHELRNPLAPIVTALGLMKLRGDDRSSREQQVIERQVKHLMHLVDDLLDVSRITRGKIELKRQRLDLRDAVANALEIASPLLEQRSHRVDVDVPSHELPVEGDDARLTQVFANLLTNAAKYTDPGGHITVSVREVARELVTEVRDDGIGMSPQLLPNVFDLFVQGRQGMDRSAGGLGIGLTLVRFLVEMHGGRVKAASEGLGRGSTFTIALPRAEGSVVQSEQERTPPRLSTCERILVVDDNEDALLLLSEALEALGHQVVTASDPVEALEVVQRFKPEVAILDIGLPVMNGYELGSRLREAVAPAPLRLIALTGYGQRHDRERTLRAGFEAHLVKPVDVQTLIASIANR